MQAGLPFPDGFLWGAATAAHQIEGGNRNTDWWRSEQRGTLPHPSADACDSWNRYAEDARLLAAFGLNAYRLSVEWARIEPTPGHFDTAALDHYRAVIEGLRELNIEPIVTLHHFTHPIWLADRGGWLATETPDRFADYAHRVARHLGDLLTWWVTVNEPNVSGRFGYLDGIWPPHHCRAFGSYVRHLRGCARGHRIASLALKAVNGSARVGLAYSIHPIEPWRPGHPGDRLATRLFDWFWHGQLFGDTLPHADWIGVNYYFRVLAQLDVRPWKLFTRSHVGPGDRSDFGWEIYPRGLYQTLRRVGAFGKPVLVTENGIADAQDRWRSTFIVDHLVEAHRAVRDGVDLRGYLHWSLMDNFEWAEGFTKRFGLASVDFEAKTKDRQPRPSAAVYARIARENGISPELLGASA